MKEVISLPAIATRKRDSHKGDYGRVLVVAGAEGMLGAGCLAAQSALRSGSGLVTLAVPKSLLAPASVKVTCATTAPLPETAELTISAQAVETVLELSQKSDVLALGPGISQHQETKDFILKLLPQLEIPVVIDADGLNNLAGEVEILKQRKAATILTPHPGEFCRLAGVGMKELKAEKNQMAIRLAQQTGCVVVLKFCPTIVTDGERIFFNRTGNPGMASGGSGDVLTGVIVSLLGQGWQVFEAAQLGVWMHGYAGDLASFVKGEMGMIASDILKALPQAFADYVSKR